MKKLVTLVLAALMLSALAITASASTAGACVGVVPQIDPGIIVVDGEMDDVYANATCVDITLFHPDAPQETGTYGKAYLLWAEGSFYLYVRVYDNDVQVPSEEMQMNSPWNTDSVEMFFDFTNEHAGDVHQFRVDFSGFPSYFRNNTGDVSAYGPEAAAPYFDDYAATWKDYGYNIEMKVNFSTIGVNLKQGDSIGFQLQINDMTAADEANVTAVYLMANSNNAKSWEADLYDYVTLGEKLVIETPVEEAPAEEAVPAEEAAPAEEAPAAALAITPKTADAGIIAAVAVMAAAAAIVLSKKH